LPDLLVVVPSRCRPADVRTVLSCAADTMRANTAYVFGFDDDDPQLQAGVAAVAGFEFATAVAGPRKGLGAWANAIGVPAAPEVVAVGLMGDDCYPITEGWDERFLEALSEPGVLMCWCDDGGHKDTRSHVVMSSRMILTLGWMAEPSMQHYVDFVWRDLGNCTGTYRYLPDVFIEHQVRPSRRVNDQVHTEVVRHYDSDVAAHDRWLTERAEKDAAKLLALISKGAGGSDQDIVP
jgi:hypothetical protein